MIKFRCAKIGQSTNVRRVSSTSQAATDGKRRVTINLVVYLRMRATSGYAKCLMSLCLLLCRASYDASPAATRREKKTGTASLLVNRSLIESYKQLGQKLRGLVRSCGQDQSSRAATANVAWFSSVRSSGTMADAGVLDGSQAFSLTRLNGCHRPELASVYLYFVI